MYKDNQIIICLQGQVSTFIQKEILNEESIYKNNYEKIVTIKSKTQQRKQYQFPESLEESDSIICEYTRVIEIYNKYNQMKRKKLTAKMEQWFLDQAKQHGWVDAKFIRCDGSTKKACYLEKNNDLESTYVSKH